MDHLLPFATAFGLALFHSLWIGGILYFAVRAIFPLLSTPAVRHNLAYGALLALVTAFSFSTYYLYEPASVCENMPAASGLLPGIILPPTGTGWSEWITTYLPAYAPWISALYLAGLLPALFLLLRDQDRVQVLSTQGVSALPTSWAESLGDELARHPATRRVRCFLSERAGEVMTLGFWSPVIVFPVALVNELSTEMARTILLHEIAHLRHYDHWLNYPQQFIRTLFFFHPAVHALCRLIDREREHRCDDWVADRCSDRRTYATALITVARSSHIPQNHLVMSATKTPFSTRIQRLFLGEDRQQDGKFIFTVLLAVLLGAGQLSFSHLGADAGAVKCLKEQGKSKDAAFLERVAILRDEAATVPTEYKLGKLDLDGKRRWAVTDPITELSKPCPTRILVEDLPYIAAPEAPASTNPRAMERYEKARRKYKDMRSLPAAEQLGLSRNAIVPTIPCRKIAPLTILPIRPKVCAKSSPKVISTTAINLVPSTSIPPSKIAIFIDGTRAEDEPADQLDPARIESVTVINSDAELSNMDLENFSGAIMIVTKDRKRSSAECSTTTP